MADPDRSTAAYNTHHMGQGLSPVYSCASLIPRERADLYLHLWLDGHRKAFGFTHI